MPAGRQQVQTKWLEPEQRDTAYGFIRKQVKAGRQAFVVCPLVDESETIESKAATEEYQRLSKDIFPDLSLGLLHGRMAGKEKDKVMRQFRDGELDILVTTPVVEVGIDVANATVMMMAEIIADIIC
jgi:ATP-dependent DNA helicase RecG